LQLFYVEAIYFRGLKKAKWRASHFQWTDKCGSSNEEWHGDNNTSYYERAL
jgi:hypothetical protein